MSKIRVDTISPVDDSITLNVLDLATKTGLATATGAGLIGAKKSFATATRTQADINDEVVSLLDFTGIDRTGATDCTAAIQAAFNALPSGCTLRWPRGTYLFSNVTLTKPVFVLGEGLSQAGTIFKCSSATNPLFTATSVNNIGFSNFQVIPSVTRTANPFFKFTNCARMSFDKFFMQDYFRGFDFDGGTEINFEDFQMFTSIVNTAGTGGFWFGQNNYTGSITLNDGYMKKLSDDIVGFPEFGVRFGYVDVANIGSGMSIIQHGHDLELVPSGAGKFCHLVKAYGGMTDIATSGIFIQPSGGAAVRYCDFTDTWGISHTTASIVVDGTNGTVEVITFAGGELVADTNVAVAVYGSGTSNVVFEGIKIKSSNTAFSLNTGANVYIHDCLLDGNTNGIATDGTVTGRAWNNIFRTNSNPLVNTNGSFIAFDNIGVDNWIDFTPVVTAQSGSSTATATGRYRRAFNTVHFEMAITVTTVGTGANAILATLPVASRVNAIATGRAINSSGSGLVGQLAPGGTNVAIRTYNSAFPAAANGEVLIISGTYEIV